MSSLPKSFLVGLLLGGALLLGAGLGEGLYLALSDSTLPFWSFLVDASAVAIWAPLTGLLGGIAVWCWATAVRRTAAPADLRATFWRWIAPETPERAAGPGAAVVTAAIVFGAATAATIPASEYVLLTIRTSVLRIATVMALYLGFGVVAVLVSPLLFVPMRWLFRTFAEYVPYGRLAVAPATAVGLLAVGGSAGLLVGLGRSKVAVSALPLEYPAAVIGAVLAAAGTAALIPDDTESLGRTVGYALLGTVVFALPTLIMPSPLEPARTIYYGQSTVAGYTTGKILEWTDFDDDGSSNFYGGGDCRPFDPDIHPTRFDEPGNGIDENCNGVELDESDPGLATGPVQTSSSREVSRKPNIIFITTDALSQGRTSLGDHDRDTTPELANWAEDAVVFESAFSLSSSTRFAWPGMLASRFNAQMPLRDDGQYPYGFAPGDSRTLVEMLDDAGYRTIFIPGDGYFSPDNWGGIGRGFDEVDMDAHGRAKTDAKTHTGKAITGAAQWYLDRHSRSKDGPLFLWVHYYDHHAPYRTPPGDSKVYGDGESRPDRFDSELRWADRHWGRLIEAVREKWDSDEYLTVFTADHGESFDHHHEKKHHGYSLRTSVLHVPFVIGGLDIDSRRVDGLASHADLLPTVADLIGAEPEEEWYGESLVPVLFDGAAPQKEVVYSLYYVPEARKRGNDPFRRVGARSDEFYFVENLEERTRRLVNWREDPAGDRDVYFQNSMIGERLRNAAMVFLERMRQNERALTADSDGRSDDEK